MIYLDNAATTFPKPRCMSDEMTKCIREYCGNPGRSGHSLSLKASEKIYECRETLASFFGSDKPENIVFTMNTTYALNMAINTLYEPGSHVLISNMEHNSVFRPITALKDRGEITYSIFNLLQPTEMIINELGRKLRPNTKMLIMLHASNICGKVFPIKEIGAFCKKHGITFIVDAAQSAGIVEIDIKKCNIDALCVPAHKGLYGPQGLGFTVFGDKPPKRIFLAGGNGVDSLSPYMGLDMPESFESGTMPTPLIAGLDTAVKWLKKVGLSRVSEHEKALACKLAERLSSINGSMLYGYSQEGTGIVLYANKNLNPDKLAEELNRKNICTRNGFHCAPLAHDSLRTGENGALRISVGFFNTQKDIDGIYNTIKSICK